MTQEEFKNLVRNMRTAQKKYFTSRNYIDLRMAKRLEQMVDDELEPNLFNQEP